MKDKRGLRLLAAITIVLLMLTGLLAFCFQPVRQTLAASYCQVTNQWSGCSQVSTPATTWRQNIVITEAENGQTIQTHVGATIELQLKASMSAGYHWAVNKTDTTILMLRDSTTVSSGDPNRVGGSSTQIFKFQTIKSGTAHLQLKHWRSFEGDSSITQWYNVTIEVQPHHR